ncbi:hypothetical protein TorRG33x02_134290, partial [Trema orientale]
YRKYPSSSIRNSNAGSEQENAEFLTRALVRVNQVKRFRVCVPHNVLVIGPHVHDLLRVRRPEPGRHDSGSDRRRLHRLQKQPDPIARLSPRREPELSAVAVHGPDGYGSERAGPEIGAVALEGDPDEPEPHLVDELVSQDRELEEEEGLGGEAIVLDAEPDVAAAVAEDCSDDHRFGRAGLRRRDGGGRGIRRRGVLVVVVWGLGIVVLGNVVAKRGA